MYALVLALDRASSSVDIVFFLFLVEQSQPYAALFLQVSTPDEEALGQGAAYLSCRLIS